MWSKLTCHCSQKSGKEHVTTNWDVTKKSMDDTMFHQTFKVKLHLLIFPEIFIKLCRIDNTFIWVWLKIFPIWTPKDELDPDSDSVAESFCFLRNNAASGVSEEEVSVLDSDKRRPAEALKISALNLGLNGFCLAPGGGDGVKLNELSGRAPKSGTGLIWAHRIGASSLKFCCF